jgi:hypothetical protein
MRCVFALDFLTLIKTVSTTLRIVSADKNQRSSVPSQTVTERVRLRTGTREDGRRERRPCIGRADRDASGGSEG